jgi:transposase
MTKRRSGNRNPSQVQAFSVREFFARFPTDDACLEHVMEVRYGLRHPCAKCLNLSTFHKLAGRPAYSCAQCGHHVYPCAGTIFQDSRTSLQSWFYAIYLFVVTRHGVSGKELQRTLGVTYKTAWRMGQQIRGLMGTIGDFSMLQGHVELDEAYLGGRQSRADARHDGSNKTIVMGMVERGGRVRTEVIPNVKTPTLRGVTLRNVAEGSLVSTDELRSYNLLPGDGYQHGSVKHGAHLYVDGIHHTNSVESFWRLFKKSVASTHIHISQKYAQRYLDEFTFRSNHREKRNAMFDLLIAAL